MSTVRRYVPTAPQVPLTIKVGACDWQVVVAPDAKLYGKTDHKSTTLTLLAGQSEPSMRDSVLHEALHAVWWCAGAQKLLDLSKPQEELIVRLLTPWVLGLLRDNPDLVTYLLASEVTQ